MANGFGGMLPGFEYVIDRRDGMFCLLCHAADRSLLSRKDEPARGIGICEPCSHQLAWAWRQAAGEVPPGFPEVDLRKVSTACVLIARRKEIPKLDAPPGDSEQTIKAPAELDSSYEFLLAANPDGTCSVPSLSLDSHPDSCVCGNCNPYHGDASRAALSLLSSFDLRSWPALVEPLYTAYSPRGRLVAVSLIRGWSEKSRLSPSLVWLPWPLSAHTGEMAGFWRAMETVWALRLHKHCLAEDAGDLCVHLRDAACRYIELQEALRSHQETDASMLPIYRSVMTVDEVAVERLIQLAAARSRDEQSLAVTPRDDTKLARRSQSRVPKIPEPGGKEAETDGDEPVPDSPWDPSDSMDEGGDDPSEEPEMENQGDGDTDPSFVRPRCPLRQR